MSEASGRVTPPDRDRTPKEPTGGSRFQHARPLILNEPEGAHGRLVPLTGRRRALVVAGTVLVLGLLGFVLATTGGSDDPGTALPPGNGDPFPSGTGQDGAGTDPSSSKRGPGTGTAGASPGPDDTVKAASEGVPPTGAAEKSRQSVDQAPRDPQHPADGSGASGPVAGASAPAPSAAQKAPSPSVGAQDPVGGAPVAYGSVLLRNVGSGLVLGAAGNRVEQHAESSSVRHVWGFSDAGDERIMLVLANTGTCLGSGALPGSRGSGAVVRSCSGQAVRWRLKGASGASVLLEHVPSGLCLGIVNRSSEAGGDAVLTSCSGTTSAERWGLEQR
ncbi:MAG: hypothetical protein QG608_732 [Actinomycetota bacterium]|nr:hypothetical protein [Actinomycetota bacterium]